MTTRSNGLVSKIRAAEAKVKTLKVLLERETGVTEDEAMLLDLLIKMAWTDHVELKAKGLGYTKTSILVSSLKRKQYLDYEQYRRIRFRINRWGKKALAWFKNELHA